MSAAAARPEDDAGLDGKVAVIAGGGAAGDGIGNGRAAAILLARAGTRMLVVDRDGALAERMGLSFGLVHTGVTAPDHGPFDVPITAEAADLAGLVEKVLAG